MLETIYGIFSNSFFNLRHLEVTIRTKNELLSKYKRTFGRSKTNCLKLKIYSKSGHSARGRDVCCLADDHYKRKKKNKIGDHDPFSTGTYLSKERQRIMDRYSNLS